MAPEPKSNIPPANNNEMVSVMYDKLTQPHHTVNSLSLLCKQISDTHINTGVTFSQLFADAYIQAIVSLCDKAYYNQNSVFSDDVLMATGAIYSTNDVKLTNENVIKLLSYNTGHILLTKYFTLGKCFDEHQTKLIFNKIPNRLEQNYYYGSKSPYIDLVNVYDVFFRSNNTLILAAEKGLYGFITRAINNKCNLPQKCLDGIIRSKNLELCKLALLSGCKLNTDVLESACETCDVEIIKFVLDNKIVPNNKCFTAIIGADDNNNNYSPYRRKSYKTICKSTTSNKSNCIDLLKIYGYKITYDDIVEATKKQIEIINFASLGIKLDEKFMEICADCGFYPYKVDGLKPTITCLQKECKKSGNLTTIRELVKGGVTPDIQCLKYACQHKSNLQTIKFLIEKGNLVPDIECLNAMIATISNRTLTYISDLYCKSVMTSKKYEEIKKGVKFDNSDDDEKSNNEKDSDSDKLSDEEKKPVKKGTAVVKNNNKQIKVILSDSDSDVVDDKSESESESESDSEPEPDTKPIVKKATPKKATPKKATPKKVTLKNKSTVPSDSESDGNSSSQSDSEQLISFDDEPVKKIKPHAKKTKPLQKKLVEINTDTESESELDANIPNLNQKKMSELCNIPENYDFKINRSIDTNLITLLNLKKNTNYSFVDVRKHLMIYMLKGKLLQDEKIKINKQLGQMVSRPENDLIALKDLDKFVYTLIKNAKEEKEKLSN